MALERLGERTAYCMRPTFRAVASGSKTAKFRRVKLPRQTTNKISQKDLHFLPLVVRLRILPTPGAPPLHPHLCPYHDTHASLSAVSCDHSHVLQNDGAHVGVRGHRRHELLPDGRPRRLRAADHPAGLEAALAERPVSLAARKILGWTPTRTGRGPPRAHTFFSSPVMTFAAAFPTFSSESAHARRSSVSFSMIVHIPAPLHPDVIRIMRSGRAGTPRLADRHRSRFFCVEDPHQEQEQIHSLPRPWTPTGSTRCLR